MVSKHSISLLLLLSLSLNGIAQKFTFTVTDSLGIGIPKVEVVDVAIPKSYFTNENGVVNIERIVNPTYLYFYKHGYEMKEGSFDYNTQPDYTIVLSQMIEELAPVTISRRNENELENLAMRSVEGMGIYSAKKTERIDLTKTTANLATNNNRQIFAKVAGLNIWESQGSGLSTEIGGRGLSPERSSNFNIRQNGYDISADALGYPDAYYVPPAEVVDHIKIVRGAASLQYGTQFGGVVNYQLKEVASDTKFQFVSRQTAGSYGFYSGYNEVSGTSKKTSYFLAHQYRRGNGWRENAGFHSNFGLAKIKYTASEKLNYEFSYTYYQYLAQQPGGLTDALYEQDAQQSIRDRNWFQVKWHLPSFQLNYRPISKLKIQSLFFGLVAQRNAVGFLGNITRIDPLDNRDLLVDHYKNIGNETRLLYKYRIKDQLQTFLIGTRIYSGFTRKQQGLGSDSNDANFTFNNPQALEVSDYDFPSRNISLFTENIFHITQQFSITPGLRFEHISTAADGYYRETTTDLAGNILVDTTFNDNKRNTRSFIILGLGASYKSKMGLELYSSFSQNYRAVNFNDLRLLNPNIQVDPNLQDETGYNFDLGVRGKVKKVFTYDISGFLLKYNNRIGFKLESDPVLFNTFRYKTNIAASRTFGVESVLEVDYLQMGNSPNQDFSLKHFVNFSLINGKYIQSDEVAFENKKVELVPNVLFKSGLNFRWKKLKLGYQFSFVGEQFTDATNATFSSDAVSGIIPSYHVSDLSLSYDYKWLGFSINVNNLSNEKYFSRRAAGYPGPGIIPADGISIFGTVQLKLKK